MNEQFVEYLQKKYWIGWSKKPLETYLGPLLGAPIDLDDLIRMPVEDFLEWLLEVFATGAEVMYPLPDAPKPDDFEQVYMADGQGNIIWSCEGQLHFQVDPVETLNRLHQDNVAQRKRIADLEQQLNRTMLAQEITGQSASVIVFGEVFGEEENPPR